MIRLLPLMLIAALLTGCSKANSKRIRTLQLSGATVVAFAGQPLPISPTSTPAPFPHKKEASDSYDLRSLHNYEKARNKETL